MLDQAEIKEILKDLEKWGIENLTQNLDTPWGGGLNIPLTDYDLYFKVNFGADRYTGDGGEEFNVRLESMKLTRKKADADYTYELSLVFLRNADTQINDTLFGDKFLKYKENNDEGKKVYMWFPMVMDLIEPFTLGNPPPDEKDDDEPEDLCEVYAAPAEP